MKSEKLMDLEFLPCPACQVVVIAERPPCVDGHAPHECPDWACTHCATALVRDPMMLTAPAGTFRPRRHTAA